MSQKKKLDKEREAGYDEGFEHAVEFFELALNSTKYVGPKTRDRIHETISGILTQAQKEETVNGQKH